MIWNAFLALWRCFWGAKKGVPKWFWTSNSVSFCTFQHLGPPKAPQNHQKSPNFRWFHQNSGDCHQNCIEISSIFTTFTAFGGPNLLQCSSFGPRKQVKIVKISEISRNRFEKNCRTWCRFSVLNRVKTAGSKEGIPDRRISSRVCEKYQFLVDFDRGSAHVDRSLNPHF